jgi:hypothetical protein
MDLDAAGRDALDSALWSALASFTPLLGGGLCIFPTPFNLAASVVLARNTFDFEIAEAMFDVQVGQHIRRFLIALHHMASGGQLPCFLYVTPHSDINLLAAKCREEFSRAPAGPGFNFRVTVNEIAQPDFIREILDTTVTHPATAAGLIDDLVDAVLYEGEEE